VLQRCAASSSPPAHLRSRGPGRCPRGRCAEDPVPAPRRTALLRRRPMTPRRVLLHGPLPSVRPLRARSRSLLAFPADVLQPLPSGVPAHRVPGPVDGQLDHRALQCNCRQSLAGGPARSGKAGPRPPHGCACTAAASSSSRLALVPGVDIRTREEP
jgi:hypothetical protein